MSRLRLAPITIGDAKRWVHLHHSHHEAPVSGLFAVSVERDGERCCVAIAGRPAARMLTGCCEITRVASDRTPHAASMAVAAASRAAIALGYRRLVSYILLGEAGTSYRAAGWWPTSITDTTDRWDSHPRANVGSHAQPGRKVRWEFGPGAVRLPEAEAAALAALVESSVVADPGRPRADRLPLFREGA